MRDEQPGQANDRTGIPREESGEEQANNMMGIPREESGEGLEQQVQTGGHAHSLRGVTAWTIHHSVIVSHQRLHATTGSYIELRWLMSHFINSYPVNIGEMTSMGILFCVFENAPAKTPLSFQSWLKPGWTGDKARQCARQIWHQTFTYSPSPPPFFHHQAHLTYVVVVWS